MSFLNPDKEKRGQSIHVNSYRWSGGPKDFTLPDGTNAKKPQAEIVYYDGTQNQKVALPFKMAIIGVTSQVRGYTQGQTQGSGVSYWSNETVNFGDKMTVWRKDADGTTKFAEGTYGEIKGRLKGIAAYQINVYFYNFEKKQIDRFEMQGSARGPFMDYDKRFRSDKYKAFTVMTAGELAHSPVADYYPPVITLDTTPYTAEQIEEIKGVAVRFDEYEAELAKAAMGEADAAAFDQTPAQYEGEGSQEYQDAPAPTQEPTADLKDVPF